MECLHLVLKRSSSPILIAYSFQVSIVIRQAITWDSFSFPEIKEIKMYLVGPKTNITVGNYSHTDSYASFAVAKNIKTGNYSILMVGQKEDGEKITVKSDQFMINNAGCFGDISIPDAVIDELDEEKELERKKKDSLSKIEDDLEGKESSGAFFRSIDAAVLAHMCIFVHSCCRPS